MGLAKGTEVRPCASAGGPRRPTTPSSVPIASTHLLRGYGAALGLGGPSLRSSPDEEGPSSLPQGKPFCDRSKRQGRVDPVQSRRKRSRPESSTPPTNQVPFVLPDYLHRHMGGIVKAITLFHFMVPNLLSPPAREHTSPAGRAESRRLLRPTRLARFGWCLESAGGDSAGP